MLEKVHKYVREQRLLEPGDRVAVAVSGGADSVALLRALLELREDLGVVLSVVHFNHRIRGSEADADQQFVAELAEKFALELHAGSGDVPAHAREDGVSLETAARELRHRWFADLIRRGEVAKIATAHTLDDQAETVLMRILRGAGARGLAGISPVHHVKGLVRPLLEVSRQEVEAYLASLNQPWREDLSNHDLAHTRNRVRHQLLPLLEKEFNPAIRQTLADLAEVARAEAGYWEQEMGGVMPRLLREGKPSRSGRSSSGTAADTWSLDLVQFLALPLALQRLALQDLAGRIGATLEFKHVRELLALAGKKKPARLVLPGGLTAAFTFRELQLSRAPVKKNELADYQFVLPVPGEVAVSPLGSTLRASLISAGKQKVSGYNPALLLDRARLQGELIVRNWRPGDRYFPAHSRAPKKVKELLQAGRLGRPLSVAERKIWPVIESAGQIVWMRGFPVPEAFVHHAGDAVLIEEIQTNSGAEP